MKKQDSTSKKASDMNQQVLADLFSESEQSSFTEINHSQFSENEQETEKFSSSLDMR